MCFDKWAIDYGGRSVVAPRTSVPSCHVPRPMVPGWAPVGGRGRPGMAAKAAEGGASTYIYGLIFLLYAGIAVILLIYMMNRR